MATSGNVVRERRSAGNVMDRLHAQRTEMLVQFCRLAGVEPFGPDSNVQGLLQVFCQTLVDYFASAHFLLYERIVNGMERRRPLADLASNIYPQISRCTEIAIDFNDKYDCEDRCERLNDLPSDLSRLGIALAERIELEDRLLAHMTVPA
ncbi:MAG: Rsd/AlgQ family anti-sigma factor [Acidiferrobacteraceae bacterium]